MASWAFSVKSEFIRLTDERLGQSIEETDLTIPQPGMDRERHVGCDRREEGGGFDSPLRPLFRGPFFKGWIGAVELAARAERIRFGSVDSDISGVLPSTAPRAEIVLGNSDLPTFGRELVREPLDQDSAEPGAARSASRIRARTRRSPVSAEPHRAVSVFDVRANVMARLCLRKAILLTAVVAALAIAGATPAIAQTDEFFDPNTIQEIRLTINTRDLRTLREVSRQHLLHGRRAVEGHSRAECRRAVAGNSSRNDRKMALRVDADRYVTGQRFLGLKSFVLKNLWTDPSMLRELAMTMFSRLGQPASRHRTAASTSTTSSRGSTSSWNRSTTHS